MSSCRIYVVCHLPGACRKSDVFVPMCVGKRKDEFSSDFLRDDEGDNIAERNDTYNELTALYRIWKDPKLHADYIGLMHYRRYLGIGLKKSYYLVPSQEKAMELVEKTEDKWRSLSRVDMVLPYFAHYASVKEYYARAHDGRDIEVLQEVFRKYFPEDADVAKEYLEGGENHLGNLVVMKKELFLRYAEWLFAVLEKYIEERKPTGRLFISERLTGIFIKKAMKEGKQSLFVPPVTVEPKTPAALKNKKDLLHALLPTCVWQEYYRRLYRPKGE